MAPPGLHVEMHGAGEPLLLIAGLGQASWVWQDVLPAFAERRRVTIFDNRGTGRSPGPGRASVTELATDAASLLEGPTDLLGLSMGGYVALTVALDRPDLVRSLVLIGTGAGGAGRVSRPRHVVTAFSEAMGLPHEEFGRRTMPYTFAPGWTEANPERFERALAARLERPTAYESLEAHVAACYDFYAAARVVERIEVPALVIHGDQDLIVPVENGRLLASRLPDARYVELPGRGHNLVLEEPDTIGGLVLEFLDRP